MRRAPLAVAFLLLLAAAAYVVDPLGMRDGDRRVPGNLPGEPPEVPSPVPEAAGPVLRGAGGPETGTGVGAEGLPPPVDLASVDREQDLHGIVTRKVDGAPIAGATVTFVRFPWRRTSLLTYDRHDETVEGPVGRSAADGTFRLRLPPGTQGALRVAATGFATVEIAARQAGERVDVVLAEGVRLTLVTRDPAGRPVEGTRLRLWSREGDVTSLRGVTGPDGACVLGWLPGGAVCTVSVMPVELGYPGWETVRLPERGDREHVVVLAEGRTLTGRVLDAESGAPIAGARVGMNWVMQPHVVSGPDGAYRLPGWLGKGVTDVHCVADGYGRSQWVVDGDQHDFALARGDSVTGRLVGPDARPVAGAQVSAIGSERRGGQQENCAREGISGPDGRFLLAGLRRDMPHTLVVLAEGYGRHRQAFGAHEVVPGTVDLGDVALPPARALGGRVLDGDGRPLPRVPVRATDRTPEGGGAMGGSPPLVLHYGRSEERVTDDLGRFRFRDLAPGGYTLIVRRPGAAEKHTAVTLPEGEDLLDVEVRLPVSHEIVVSVVDEEGGPVSMAYVTLRTSEPTLGARTDAEGKARLFVSGVVQAISAHPPVLGHELLPIAERPVEDAREYRLVLPRADRIAGRVATEAGLPLADAWVVAGRGTERVGTAKVSADGTFVLQVPRGGTYEVDLLGVSTGTGTIESEDWAADPVQAEAGATGVEVRARRVARDRTLRVRVTLPDGTPAAGAIALVGGRGARAGDDGVVEFSGLPAKAASVRAAPRESTSGFVGSRPQDVVPAGQEVALALRPARATTGKVLQPDGFAARGAQVQLWEGDELRFTAITDAEGRFQFPTAEDEPGPWRIRAVSETLQGEARDVPTGDSGLRIHLR